MEEKIKAAPELSERSPMMKWLENYWYHYKWHTLLALFILLTVVFMTAQCVNDTPTDVTVTYAGNVLFSDTELQGLNQVLSDACPVDVDGNGDTAADFPTFSIYNEEQLKELYTYVDPETGETRVDQGSMMTAKQYNAERIKTMQNYIMTGDCAVWFVSPYVYESMFAEKVRIVEKVDLKDTALYRTYDAVKQVFPKDTVVLLTYPTMGAYSKAEAYAVAEQYFYGIVGGEA